MLCKSEVCAAKAEPVPAAVVQTPGLTFESALQFEKDKLRRYMDREKKFDREKLPQVEKLALEKMWQNTEKLKLELEQSKLQLIRIRQAFSMEVGSNTEDSAFIGSVPCGIDVVANLCLVLKFNEHVPDIFSLFSSILQMQKSAFASVHLHWESPGGRLSCMWRGWIGL